MAGSARRCRWRRSPGVCCIRPKPELRLRFAAKRGNDLALARKGARLAYFPELGGMAETPVYDRYRLGPGAAFDGPAIVEERESTLIVGPGGRCSV